MADTDRIKKRWLEAVARTGYGEQFLRSYDAVFGLPHLGHLDRIDAEITEYELGENARGSVLIPMVPGAHVNNYRECILAHAFETRGYRAITPTCGGELAICPHRIADSAAYVGDACFLNARRTAEAFGYGMALSDILPDSYTPPPLPAADGPVEYRGVPIAEYAAATTRKYFRQYRIDLTDERTAEVYQRFLQSAQVLTDAYERVFEHDVCAVIVYEDHYVHGGVPIALAEQYGVPAYSVETGYRDGTLVFGKSTNRNTQPQYTDREFVRETIATPLTEAERREVDRLIDKRESGSGSVYNYSARTDVSVDGDAEMTVGVFTNLPWDASLELEGSEMAFADVFEWLGTTIDRLGGRNGVKLVVKTHPAELVYGTNESVSGWIDSEYESLPGNVRVLGPDTDVNTYELIEDLDAGIVYASTVGLEMAYHGLPVVVAGDTHYRGLGFTHDPDDASAYADLLASIDDLSPRPKTRERARRYAHVLFVRKHVSFPFYSIGPTATAEGIELLPVSHDDITPGNENFDLIVEKMIEGEPVVNERTRTDDH